MFCVVSVVLKVNIGKYEYCKFGNLLVGNIIFIYKMGW